MLQQSHLFSGMNLRDDVVAGKANVRSTRPRFCRLCAFALEMHIAREDRVFDEVRRFHFDFELVRGDLRPTGYSVLCSRFDLNIPGRDRSREGIVVLQEQRDLVGLAALRRRFGARTPQNDLSRRFLQRRLLGANG